jgi:hypothetical protein
MDIKELRIGNYIRHTEDKTEGVIAKFYINDVYINDWSCGTTPLSECEPIPLTEEWLLKFGFEKNNFSKVFGISNGRYDLIFTQLTDNYSVLYLKFDDCQLTQMKSIQYVHQLQNLYFALTQEELTVKELA